MSEPSRCPASGAPFSDAGVELGLCSRCLVRLALDSGDETRTVAIKLIRPGLDCAQVLARFDAERQAMALMDQPGIARIHVAGAAEDGRPSLPSWRRT